MAPGDPPLSHPHGFSIAKKGQRLKTGVKVPADLDAIARRKFRELIEVVDPEVDSELVANYARMHSSLMAIRIEKAKQIKKRTYQALVPGRDKTMTLNPLQVAENRMTNSLNRMLRTLGLAPSREEQKRRQPVKEEDELDALEAALQWPFAYTWNRIWSDIRRGKPEPSTPEEHKAEKDEHERRMNAWKESHGMPVDIDEVIPAPPHGCSEIEFQRYHEAKQAWQDRIVAACRAAGLDPYKC